jgi:hypothetical protein
VVGIAWVVECVEQRALLDEARFKVNLDGVNVAGTNKVCLSSLAAFVDVEIFSWNPATEIQVTQNNSNKWSAVECGVAHVRFFA